MSKSAPSIEINGRLIHKDTLMMGELNLLIQKNQWTCIIGPSGIGKSTLLRIIAGLETHVRLNGTITCSDRLSLEDRVSYMAQDDLLIPWANVATNISLGSKLRGEVYSVMKKNEIIERVGLLDHLNKYPNELSGGQRQRVALARTIMENTPIVLLDEPFSSLDAKTREEMIELTYKNLIGKTVLLVTHEPGEALRLCESIYILGKYKFSRERTLKPPFPKTYFDKKVFELQHKLLDKIRETHDV